MGAPARLKIKDELHYRKGSTNESRNCRYCVHFVPDYPVEAIGGGTLGVEARCRVIGLQNSRRYRVRGDYTCGRQQFDETKKTW